MAGRSQLEGYLLSLHAEGTLDSSGSFTLSLEKALQKLSAYLLPRDTAWVSKVVQAAVLSGATFLKVKQTSTDTEFYFDPRDDLTLDAVESAFFDPAVNPVPALEHLKIALWSVSLKGRRPFHCAPPRSTQSLIWTGTRLERPNWTATDHFCLTVSHRTLEQGEGLPILRSIDAARVNSAIGLELTNYAFVCPIPLSLDGRRLDALQACKTHTLSQGTHPFQLFLVEANAPLLPIPPATFLTRAKSALDVGPLQGLLPAVQPNHQAAAACLVSLSAQQVTEGKVTVWRRTAHRHVFYWVRHGVVVECHEIPGLAPSCVSCAVFASAQGLRSDLTGFAVASDTRTIQRESEIYRALRPSIEGAALPMDRIVERAKQSARLWGGVEVLGGACLSLATGWGGFGLAAMGVLTFLTGGDEEARLTGQLTDDVSHFRQTWARALPKMSVPVKVILVANSTRGTSRDQPSATALIDQAGGILGQAGISLQVVDMVSPQLSREALEEAFPQAHPVTNPSSLPGYDPQLINLVCLRRVETHADKPGATFVKARITLIPDSASLSLPKLVALGVAQILGLRVDPDMPGDRLAQPCSDGHQLTTQEVELLRQSAVELFG